jgi:hypothetical protein
VLVSITVVSPTRSGGVTAWKSATPRPGTTTLQFAAGQEISDVALVPLSDGGFLDLYNASGGSEHLVVDVHGYFAPTTVPAPVTQTGRYLSSLTDAATDSTYQDDDVAAMQTFGKADALAGKSFILLDLGAQTITAPLSAANPGIALAETAGPTRLAYSDLATFLNAYLTAFGANSGGRPATIAIGTSNDGDWTTYGATARGTDFAHRLLDQLGPSGNITIDAADDIEPDFGSAKVSDALAWKSALQKADPSRTLIFNGAASGCPTSFGATGGSCNLGWTEAQLYQLAGGGQVKVLPQIFNVDMAAQWANIDATGGGHLNFLGALTEHARVPTELAPGNGFAALYRALSAVPGATLPASAVDLAVDGG